MKIEPLATPEGELSEAQKRIVGAVCDELIHCMKQPMMTFMLMPCEENAWFLSNAISCISLAFAKVADQDARPAGYRIQSGLSEEKTAELEETFKTTMEEIRVGLIARILKV